MVVDMLWNILSASPRVIALAMFACYEVHWFWYIGGTHVVVMTGVSYFFDRGNEERDAMDIIWCIALAAWMGFGCLFNFCSLTQQSIRFRVYLLYWLMIFIENTLMISLWYHWSKALDLWYLGIVDSFITLGYPVSLAVECLHAYFYNGRERIPGICKWFFHPGVKQKNKKKRMKLSYFTSDDNDPPLQFDPHSEPMMSYQLTVL